MRRLLLAILVALALTPPAAAQSPPAQGPYSEGEVIFGVGINCTSLIFPPTIVENQIAAGAAFQGSPEDIPAAGEVFYVRLLFGVVGNVCGGTSLLPEFIPPEGVFPAISEQRPVLWRYGEGELQNGSTKASTGGNGGVVISTVREGQDEPWPLATYGDPVEIYVPVVSSRKLVGIGSPQPNCPERENGDAPCKPQQSGDHLQIVAQATCPCTPSTLIPYVGLFAGPPDKPAVKRKGRKLTVTTAPLATVKVRAKKKTLRKKASRAGVATIKLPRKLHGKLTITATTTDGMKSKATRKKV